MRFNGVRDRLMDAAEALDLVLFYAFWARQIGGVSMASRFRYIVSELRVGMLNYKSILK